MKHSAPTIEEMPLAQRKEIWDMVMTTVSWQNGGVGPTALANHLDITYYGVLAWRKSGFPISRLEAICRFVNCAHTPIELRPDIRVLDPLYKICSDGTA